MSVSNVYGVGLRSVGAYQVSGIPYLTGSTINASTTYNTSQAGELKLAFPTVTQSIMFANTSTGTSTIRIHFVSSHSSTGWTLTKHHYWSLKAGESITMNVKSKEVYLSAGSGTSNEFELIADLTNIPTGSMFALTGSGITE